MSMFLPFLLDNKWYEWYNTTMENKANNGGKREMKIRIGQKVYSALNGGRSGIVFQIHGEQRPETVRQAMGGAIVTGGRAHMDVVFEDGTISKQIPESIIRTGGWKVFDEVATEEEIDKQLVLAAAEKIRRELDVQAEKERQERRRMENIRTYHYLLKKADKPDWSDHRLAAVNIRRELSRAFPGVKFTVKSKSYTGGDSINIGWLNGPTGREVAGITNKYQEGSFDGMTDCYNYDPDESFRGTFGGAKYVFNNRDYTVEGLNEAWKRAGWAEEEITEERLQRDCEFARHVWSVWVEEIGRAHV